MQGEALKARERIGVLNTFFKELIYMKSFLKFICTVLAFIPLAALADKGCSSTNQCLPKMNIVVTDEFDTPVDNVLISVFKVEFDAEYEIDEEKFLLEERVLKGGKTTICVPAYGTYRVSAINPNGYMAREYETLITGITEPVKLILSGANSSPSVTIVDPKNHAVFGTNTRVRFSVLAFPGNEGTITQVRIVERGGPFFRDLELTAVGNNRYTGEATLTTPGLYNLLAQATDSKGRVAISSFLLIQVGTPTVQQSTKKSPTTSYDLSTTPCFGKFSVKVVDANTNSPLPFVKVQLESADLSHYDQVTFFPQETDSKGLAIFEYDLRTGKSSFPVKFEASLVGYTTKIIQKTIPASAFGQSDPLVTIPLVPVKTASGFEGIVRKKETGQPLTSASVDLLIPSPYIYELEFQPAPNLAYSKKVDQNGYYKIPNLDPKVEYVLVFHESEHESKIVAQKPNPNSLTRVDAALGEAKEIEFDLCFPKLPDGKNYAHEKIQLGITDYKTNLDLLNGYEVFPPEDISQPCQRITIGPEADGYQYQIDPARETFVMGAGATTSGVLLQYLIKPINRLNLTSRIGKVVFLAKVVPHRQIIPRRDDGYPEVEGLTFKYQRAVGGKEQTVVTTKPAQEIELPFGSYEYEFDTKQLQNKSYAVLDLPFPDGKLKGTFTVLDEDMAKMVVVLLRYNEQNNDRGSIMDVKRFSPTDVIYSAECKLNECLGKTGKIEKDIATKLTPLGLPADASLSISIAPPPVSEGYAATVFSDGGRTIEKEALTQPVTRNKTDTFFLFKDIKTGGKIVQNVAPASAAHRGATACVIAKYKKGRGQNAKNVKEEFELSGLELTLRKDVAVIKDDTASAQWAVNGLGDFKLKLLPQAVAQKKFSNVCDPPKPGRRRSQSEVEGAAEY